MITEKKNVSDMKYRYHGTDIDGHTLEQLYVRGRNLNDLIGNFSFSGAIYHLLTGKIATPSAENLLNCYLVAALTSLRENDPVLEVISTVIDSGAKVPYAIIAALMVDRSQFFAKIESEFSLETIGLERNSQIGLYYLGLIPALMAVAIKRIQSLQESDAIVKHVAIQKLPLASEQPNFLAHVFTLCANRNFRNSTEATIFNDTMVALHAGCGFLPPTVMLPRIASSTRAPIPQAIAAGFTAAGPSHIGACSQAMEFFSHLYHQCQKNLEIETIQELEKRLSRKEKIVGFGHPVFKVDPRSERLREILKKLDRRSDFIRIYDLTAEFLHQKRGISPNIDGIVAAIFLSLGLAPPYGTGLFLCSRTTAMVAHLLEQRDKPPFGATSKEIRKWFGPFAIGMEE